jgi:Uma2 family endonuclease
VNAAPIHTRRWTRAEYYRLDELGIFHPTERLELVGGQIVVKERQSPAHATAIRLAKEAFEVLFRQGWDVRTRAPITLDAESEPEPDIAVVPGGPRDYLAAHPSCPPLVLEVAEATLPLDRDHKSSLYARAQIPDYWLVNLPDHVLEVYRQPTVDVAAPYGFRYGSVVTLRGGDSVSPLALPSAYIAVADLLP